MSEFQKVGSRASFVEWFFSSYPTTIYPHGPSKLYIQNVYPRQDSCGCKGNLAVLRKSLKLARDDPKRIYKNNIYNQGLDTTDLARDDPKRIL